jgi:hypothetical protein
MELVFFVAALCLLGILALRFGYDSRFVPYSKEHELAGYGMRWEVHHAELHELRREAAAWRLAQQARPRRQMRIRRSLARALRRLAYMLSPEVQHRATRRADGGVPG